MRAPDARLPVGTALSLTAVLAAACWGDVVPVWPDGSVDDDTDPGAAQPITGGGLGGGPLNGRLDLFLLHEETGEPLAGSRVLLETAGGETLISVTGPDGHAVFIDGTLTGPVVLHVLAEGFVAESFLDLNAALATLLLRPVHPSPAPDPATISGTVSGWEDLPEPTATQYRAVLVAFGPRWSDLAVFREPLIGVPVPRVLIEVDQQDPVFELEVPPVPGALHFFAGLVETFGTEETTDDIRLWRSFAALPGIEPQPGEHLSGLTAHLDAGLPVAFHVQLGAFPSSYERADIELALDLGDQGTIWIPGMRQGGTWVFDAPEPGLPVAGVPFVVARGDQSTTPEEGASDADATPLGRYVARDPGYLPFVVPRMPSPPVQVSFDGQRFQCLSSAGTDLAQVVVSGAATGVEHWRVTVFGELPGSVDLPPFPADWGFGAIPAAPLLVRVWTAAYTEPQAGLRFADYADVVRETAFEAVETGSR